MIASGSFLLTVYIYGRNTTFTRFIVYNNYAAVMLFMNCNKIIPPVYRMRLVDLCLLCNCNDITNGLRDVNRALLDRS